MTIKELSQLYYLNREIEMDKNRLANLESIVTSASSPELSGMPRAPGANDKVCCRNTRFASYHRGKTIAMHP